MSEISVGCDEEGVWRQADGNPRIYLPWPEITRVTGGRVDCITWVETVLAFDHESGHYLEVNDSFIGYDSVVEFLGQHFSLPENWHASILDLEPRDDCVVIWKRADHRAT